MLAIETEAFPTNALSSEYFLGALKSTEYDVFVAEDILEYCVVGYLKYEHMFYFILLSMSFYFVSLHFILMQRTYISCRNKRYKAIARIESLAVSTRHRGKKIGDRLLCHCVDYLSAYRKTISLHVNQKNKVAYALYIKYPSFIIAYELI